LHVTSEEILDARAVAVSRGSRLYLGNLAFAATPDDVRAAAEEIGEVTDVVVPQDFSGRSRNRGFAFVQYRDTATAKLALERLAGSNILGRSITVDWASSGKS
jgi:RNA recognition motif-containing protein